MKKSIIALMVPVVLWFAQVNVAEACSTTGARAFNSQYALAHAIIEDEEGVRPRPYSDSVGVRTVGAGITTQSGCIGADELEQGLTPAQERELYARTFETFLSELEQQLTREPTSEQLAALMSLYWNIGGAQFSRSSVRRLFNAGECEAAADAFLLYNRAGEQVSRGLTARRERERALFLQGCSAPTTAPAAPEMEVALR